jgi:hypothetical protein
MDLKRRSLPGIAELLKSEKMGGKTGELVDLIKKRLAERLGIAKKIEKVLFEWTRIFMEFNRLDGELDAYELMLLKEAGKCDIVKEIVDGSREAAKERAKGIMDTMGKKEKITGVMLGMSPDNGIMTDPYLINRLRRIRG